MSYIQNNYLAYLELTYSRAPIINACKKNRADRLVVNKDDTVANLKDVIHFTPILQGLFTYIKLTQRLRIWHDNSIELKCKIHRSNYEYTCFCLIL